MKDYGVLATLVTLWCYRVLAVLRILRNQRTLPLFVFVCGQAAKRNAEMEVCSVGAVPHHITGIEYREVG